MIISANLSDSKILTEIALKSKAYWGYSKELLHSWTNDLTVTTDIISNTDVFKYIVDNKTVGFYILNPPKEKTIELEMLFVLPEFIGRGFGKQLLQNAVDRSLKLNVKSIIVLADPNAVPFYKLQGFYKIDKKESSISGRFLPIMQKDLKE
jgi:N-acetylglutamate synthase-like GNAT family acetyltransferase